MSGVSSGIKTRLKTLPKLTQREHTTKSSKGLEVDNASINSPFSVTVPAKGKSRKRSHPSTVTSGQLTQQEHSDSATKSSEGLDADSVTTLTEFKSRKISHPSTVTSGQLTQQEHSDSATKSSEGLDVDSVTTLTEFKSRKISHPSTATSGQLTQQEHSDSATKSSEGLDVDSVTTLTEFKSRKISHPSTATSGQTSTNSTPLNSSAPQYLSNESVTDDEDLSGEVVKRSRGVGRDWIFVQSFDDPKIAEEVLTSDFKIEHQHKTSTGLKSYFYCKHKPCPAMFQICYNRNTTVLLKSSDHDHNITSSTPARLTRIPGGTKSKIKELRDMKLKPKQILSTMRQKYPELTPPTLKQLYGLNSRKGRGENKISLGELEQWLKERSAIPEDDHTVFVVHYEVDYDAPSFRFFLSTQNLIKQSSQSNIVHADTTYKLNYEGFPVLVIGTTDLDRHLHPCGVSVCTDERTDDFTFIFQTFSSGVSRVLGQCYKPTTLVADAAEAIHNGFTAVFGIMLIIMCWAHVKRAIKKRYRSKSNLDEILNDLDMLQLSPSIEAFHIALTLFFEKWKAEKEFITYFKEQWVDHNCNWYEGVKQFTPKTDNALEGKNKWIKDSHTMRERLPLAQFLNELVRMVNDWSCDYIQDKVFITQPTIDLPLWTKAYQWVKLSKRVIVGERSIDLHENEKVYTFKIPSSNFDTVVEFDLSRCKSLDEFRKFAFAFYSVEMPSNNWKKGTCTCPSFYKKFICKHLVGMAMRYKLVEPPLAAKSVPLGEKRKRGRPKKAKHALLVG